MSCVCEGEVGVRDVCVRGGGFVNTRLSFHTMVHFREVEEQILY